MANVFKIQECDSEVSGYFCIVFIDFCFKKAFEQTLIAYFCNKKDKKIKQYFNIFRNIPMYNN